MPSFAHVHTHTRPIIEPVERRLLLTTLDGSEVVGLPTSMQVNLYTFVGDHSVSNSEKWSMRVGDRWHSSPDFGVVQRDYRAFKRGEAYPIQVRHDASNRSAGPDYDYRAWIDRYANPAWTSAPFTITGPNHFVVDDNAPALMQKRWFGEDQNNAANKEATLVIPGIDLDVDTANDDGFGVVYDNAAEDRDEELSDRGKIVVANTGDMDDDGVIDLIDFDGITGAAFVPMFLRLPASMELAGASLADITFTFSYNMAELVGGTLGLFRLWTVDAPATRGEDEFIRHGEQVTAADLGLGFGETVTLYVECVNGAATPRPVTVSGSVMGTQWSGAVQDTIHLSPVSFQLSGVGFSESNPSLKQVIHRDDGTGAYTGAEWLDVNGDGDVDDPDDHHYPVGFRAGAAMRTIRDFRVKAPTTIVEQKDDLVVRGIADGGYEFFSRSSVDPNDPFNVFDIAVTLGNGNFITGDTASEAFPATVEHYDPMKIKWSVSTDGGTTWNSVADSHNQLYTFIGSPTGVVHHTTAHLASRGAAGREEPASIVDGIWTEFADNEVHRVDGTLLRYSHSEHGFGHTASEMLSREDGRGQCTAWAELLVAALDTHGILAVSVRVRAEHPDIGFSVRAMPAQGSLGQNYTDAGVWPKVFGYHQVVRVPMLFNRIYDPSYGSLTEPTDGRTVLLTYEDENVTHFWRVVNDVLLDRPNQPNDAQILEFFVP